MRHDDETGIYFFCCHLPDVFNNELRNMATIEGTGFVFLIPTIPRSERKNYISWESSVGTKSCPFSV